jgi:hypothetical protein
MAKYSRYIGYFSMLKEPPQSLERKLLQTIRIRPIPNFSEGFRPIIEIVNTGVIPHKLMFVSQPKYFSPKSFKTFRIFQKLDLEAAIPIGCAVEGGLNLTKTNNFRFHD